ncbi:MAG: DUF262 domain-containing protein [Candidatus Poribacteria bacterium]|nr:DUF262 domain-containing protein [Candidatus Poribacteria bacterium]
MFETHPIELDKLLEDAKKCRLQLPDFQRGWVWDNDQIRGLLASVSRGFPVGIIMTLEAGSQIKFSHRPIEGIEPNGIEPKHYLLDGQQRITSLYQAVVCKEPVKTKSNQKQSISRHYYIDMKKALDKNTDREDAILSVPENRIVKRNFRRETELDLSTPEKEYQQCMFPVDRIFDDRECRVWMTEYQRFWENQDQISQPAGNANKFYDDFHEKVVKNFLKYKLPVIRMTNETPKEAVCTIFEKVNTGGVDLTVFELVTASFAAESEDFSLRDDWDKRYKSMKKEYNTLTKVKSDHFLQAVALLATQEKWRKHTARNRPENEAPSIGCRRRDILNLELVEYNEWADLVQIGFLEAAKFLRRLCIYRDKDIPYQTQLVPLAVLYVEMGADLDNANALDRLERWFWCGVFSESYSSGTEALFSRDLRETPGFIRGGSDPTLIREANIIPERLLALRTRTSAAYKGIFALQMKNDAADWRTEDKISDKMRDGGNVDIHHIFPRAWFKKYCPDVDSKIVDSIINKTAIDATTNGKISGSAPSAYLARFLDKNYINETALDSILRKHWIDPESLKADNFAQFFVKRGQALLDLIGNAMGKNLGNGTEIFRGPFS